MVAGALHWITHPYIHELKYTAATGTIDTRMTNVFGFTRQQTQGCHVRAVSRSDAVSLARCFLANRCNRQMQGAAKLTGRSSALAGWAAMADMQGATASLSFERFINTINKEQARDLVKNINLFMKNFRAKEIDCDSDSRAVQNFLADMEEAFAQHPLWAGASRADLDAACEGLEKYLMTKLFDRTFQAYPSDRERDESIALRLQALQFVGPQHLEIPLDFAADGSLLLAHKELKKINMFKSPRDKLSCILSCCRVITNLLGSRKHGAGADDFTPVLVYITIKAAPEHLASNLAFIERFRAASRLVSEAQYYFVQMQGALAFVETLDAHSSLKVDPDELLAHMLAAGAITEEDLGSYQLSRRSSAAGPGPLRGHPSFTPPP
ncbi:hypothetical protein QJQ45_024286 [Haematococcus lacustris]|nr:hypothetical protein QJQ45_024286 [Haematococcus lacustris]